MSRFNRPKFDPSELDRLLSPEARNHLLFDWWCEDEDRLQYIRHLDCVPTAIPSRSPLQDDPAPPVTERVPQGLRDIYLISDPAHVRTALTSKQFSNVPYAVFGGAAFLLAQNPGCDASGVDWHAEQQAFINEALNYCDPGLRVLSRLAIEQAELTALVQSEFDLASFAEQAGLRYLGQLYGYAFHDHGLLEDASRATYRALQYIAIGQHFVTEPGTLPGAQQALGQLVARTSQLIEDYTQLERSPRRHGYPPGRAWPHGVQPWSELGLDLELSQPPLLRRAPGLASQLGGRDRAVVLATLLAGTLGNVQSAVCLLVRSLLADTETERARLREITDAATLERIVELRLAELPPVPVVPRRTRGRVDLDANNWIPADTDCLLLLEGQPGCQRIWGDVAGQGAPAAIHACLGRRLALPLIAALVQRTLKLPGLKPALDPLTAEPIKLERLWGFACTRYPLMFERERVRAQRNLIVAMRVKSPVSENAARLRRLIAGAVPRIEHVLNGFGHVHFAWFEFSDGDRQLVLRTIYDGQFDSYIHHFALRAGDLFDGLFEYLEDAPPRPVGEHPQDFVEAIRRHNLAPLAGYLFSARPDLEGPYASRARKLP